ncbi:hypothetical protein DCC81_23915 [Chitinophaga parva]|uniref:Uncharacterized protein n=1 Tax=Chitinophaga parva TaxID=2169414 RepID=A0A2T7BE99_9BACT|nr:hypothetical protein [Chitinophaga parva]PUZ23428.1 hypothetical protein DCC81_23915 [Chitinophaga parva]
MEQTIQTSVANAQKEHQKALQNLSFNQKRFDKIIQKFEDKMDESGLPWDDLKFDDETNEKKRRLVIDVVEGKELLQTLYHKDDNPSLDLIRCIESNGKSLYFSLFKMESKALDEKIQKLKAKYADAIIHRVSTKKYQGNKYLVVIDGKHLSSIKKEMYSK